MTTLIKDAWISDETPYRSRHGIFSLLHRGWGDVHLRSIPVTVEHDTSTMVGYASNLRFHNRTLRGDFELSKIGYSFWQRYSQGLTGLSTGVFIEREITQCPLGDVYQISKWTLKEISFCQSGPRPGPEIAHAFGNAPEESVFK